MNVEKRREYYQQVSQMNDDRLQEESKKLNWRQDVSLTVFAGTLLTICGLSAIGIITHQYEMETALASAVLTAPLAYTAHRFNETLQRRSAVINNLLRRGMSINMTRADRWGLRLRNALNRDNPES